MRNTVETILFAESACQRFLPEYCSHNAAALAEYGVLYPRSGSRELSGMGYAHSPLIHFLHENDGKYVLQSLRDIQEETAKTAVPVRAICLSLTGIILYNPENVHFLQKICKQIFPEATVKIFFPIVSQDVYFEKVITDLIYEYGLDTHFLSLRFPLPDYAEILRQLNAYEAKNITCRFSTTTVALSARDALDGVNAALGLDKGVADALTGAFHSQYDVWVPREVLRFISLSMLSPREFTPFGLPEPWAEQLRRFTPEAGYAPEGRSLLGPTRRAEILAQYAMSNAEAARMLGAERLFPDPEPEPDWEPFMGLTAEIAFRIAERLDRDFAATLLEEFDATPIQYLTREQRLCQQALHDTVTPQSTVSLPRVSSPPPKVSVLTLTYNHESYIAECMESVIAQKTDFPFQHIIADDGSDDGTQEIILDYAAKYPHIVPVFQKTRTFGRLNVRALFDMARTEYVALCDGDDYFTDPAKLQSQADLLDADKSAALCFHTVYVRYEDGSGREGLFPRESLLPRGVRPFYYLGDLFRRNFIQTNSVMYRWRFANGLPGWFRTDLMPGDWYWHLLHAETGKIAFIDKVMSVYRRHKKGAYYLSEIDRLKHRATTGMAELEAYKVINAHFGGKFEAMLLPLAYGVFMDCSRYDAQRAKEEGREPVLDDLCAAYPDFARHFLDAQTRMSGARVE